MKTKVLYTIGHSNRPIEAFVEMLWEFEIGLLVDIRTVPRSRHNPQFNKDELAKTLPLVGIDYLHCKELGGLRHARPDSVNDAWRNASFRGYADYMQTREFAHALSELKKLALQKRVAIMCAEAVPWRCHRSLIGDALTAQGWQVLDVISTHSARPHRLTLFAVVTGRRVIYPAKRLAKST